MLDSLVALASTDLASTIVLGVVALVIAVLAQLGFSKKHNLGRCLLAFQSAVQEVYECYVKGIKKANEDGKLTEEEKTEAVAQAYSRAKGILAEEGLELARYYKPRISRGIIEAMVKRSKTAGRIAKGLLSDDGPELDKPGSV